MLKNTLERLEIALGNCNKRCFKEILEESVDDIHELEDQDKFNIFHIFATTHLNECIIQDFLQMLFEFISLKFPVEPIKNLLKSKTSRTGSNTPLHLAIAQGKTVFLI